MTTPVAATSSIQGGRPNAAMFQVALAAARAAEKKTPNPQNQARLEFLQNLTNQNAGGAKSASGAGAPSRRVLAGGDIEMGDMGASGSGAANPINWNDNPLFSGITSALPGSSATSTTSQSFDPAAAFAELPNYISDSGSVAGSDSQPGSALAVGLGMRAFQQAKLFTQSLGYSLVAPWLPRLQRSGLLQGLPLTQFNPAAGAGAGAVGFGTGIAINKASTAAFGPNPNFLYGSGAGALVSGVLNLGYARLPGFDTAATAAGGALGPYSKNLGRSIGNGAQGFVAGMVVNALIHYSGQIGDFFSSLVRPNNATIAADQPQLRGRKLLDKSKEVADAQGIYDASAKVWQSWTSDPAIKSELQSLIKTPAGAAMVGQMVTSEGASQYAQAQAHSQLAAFQKSDPTGYSNYINHVTTNFGLGNGPENNYATAVNAFVTANQGLQTLMNTRLAAYIHANPNGSMTAFYQSLSAQDKAQINSYAAAMNSAGQTASTDISLAQSDFNYYSTEQKPLPAQAPPASTKPPATLPGYTPLGAGQVIGSSAATGAAAGSVAGLFGGPFAEVTVPVGAAIGGGLGAVAGAVGWAIFGG